MAQDAYGGGVPVSGTVCYITASVVATMCVDAYAKEYTGE